MKLGKNSNNKTSKWNHLPETKIHFTKKDKMR